MHEWYFLGKLLAIAAAVTNSTVFNAPGLSLAAGLAFLLLCGLAFGFGLAASPAIGLLHLLVVSLTCCNHPRLLLVAVSTIAWARGTSTSCGFCAMSAEVPIRSFLMWSATMAARKCTWLILPGMLSVTNTRLTKALTYSSCSADVIFRQTSMYCVAANTSSPTAVSSQSKGFQNLASVWNLWAALVPRHTAPSGSCCKNDTEVPFMFGWTQQQLRPSWYNHEF